MYVRQINNLNQALKHGLQLKKIHQVIRFEKAIKPYIILNTKLRPTAKNEFEKNIFKLMNKCVLGIIST